MKTKYTADQLSQQTVTKPDRWLALIIFALLLVSLFLNLGLAPLKHEEPRRALIALEMMFRDNWIVPTEFGEYYYKKPPLFNWVLIAGLTLFEDHPELGVRFFPILSFIGMGLLVFWMGKRYVNFDFGMLAGLLTLSMVDILYYFSATAGEIDLFYSLLTLAGFFTIFHFYQRQQYGQLFIFTYLLGALGTLTKGLPSIVFLGISIGIFFLYQRELKRLLSKEHFLGIAVYLLVVGGYFYWYSQYNSLEGLFAKDESLWSQASDRTLLRNTFTRLVPHFLLFPLDTLQNIAPASLLIIFLFQKKILSFLSRNQLILCCLIIFMANILVYWISPGTRSRYVYMLYPLAVMVLSYGYFYHTDRRARLEKLFRYLVAVLIGLTLLACLTMPFIESLAELSNLQGIALGSLLAASTLLFYWFKKPQQSLLQLIALAVIIRIIFALTVLPLRAQSGGAAIDKEDALKIVAITENAPLYMYQDQNISRTTVFYIEKYRGEVLSFAENTDDQSFFIAPEGAALGKKLSGLLYF